MVRVFTVRPGDEIRIGQYGKASNTRPALVPNEVAERMRLDPALRFEAVEPQPKPKPAVVAEPEPEVVAPVAVEPVTAAPAPAAKKGGK